MFILTTELLVVGLIFAFAGVPFSAVAVVGGIITLTCSQIGLEETPFCADTLHVECYKNPNGRHKKRRVHSNCIRRKCCKLRLT